MTQKPRRLHVTLKDVAAHIGVSHTTVSNAFSRPEKLSSDLRQKIFKTARELGYSGPDPAAQQLRKGQIGAVGLVLSHDLHYAVSDPAGLAVLRGVTKAYQSHPTNLLLIASHDKEAEGPCAAIPSHAAVDSMILYSLATNSHTVERASRRGIPLVTIDQPRISGAGFVGVDPTSGINAAVQHMLQLGHRRFGILSLKLVPDRKTGFVSKERLAASQYEMVLTRLDAYRQAFLQAGFEPEECPIWECGEAIEESALKGTMKLLQAPSKPTVIIALSDRLAIAAIKAVQAIGLSVPNDISIVGFDDIPEAEVHKLTTIRQPHEEKGQQAVKILQKKNSCQEVILQSTYIERNTVGISSEKYSRNS